MALNSLIPPSGKWYQQVAFLLTVLCWMLPHLSSAEPCIKISQWTVGTKLQRIAQEIILETYDRAGICYELLSIPVLRSEILLRSGDVDAILWRSAEYIETAQDYAIAVPIPILSGNVSLIYDKTVFQAEGIVSQMKGQTIGITLGTSDTSELITKLQGIAATAPAYRQLYGMFNSRRFSAIIIPEDLFVSYDAKSASPIQYGIHPLYRTQAVHVLGKAHQNLIIPLSAALKSVLAEASFFDRLEAIN